MLFYPQGYKQQGKSAVFLQSKEAGQVSFTLSMLPGGAEMTHTEFFKEAGSWGSSTAFEIPASQEFCISVVVSDVDESARNRSAAWALDIPKVEVMMRELRNKLDAREAELAELRKEVARLQGGDGVPRHDDGTTSQPGSAVGSTGPGSPVSVTRRNSAVDLQRLWRGHQVRANQRRAEEEKQRKTAMICKIVRIQRMWRRRQARLHRRLMKYDDERMHPQRPSSQYDLVVRLTSLCDFVTTGSVEMMQSAESLFNMAQASQYRIVAVVGLFDKGKTFLVNKLFNLNLPSGKMFTTTGLSFAWVPHKRMLVLDSAGLQSTVSYRSQTVQPMVDAQSTESLLFEMIARVAHNLIFVVSDLTWFEQKYIAMLHQKCVQ